MSRRPRPGRRLAWSLLFLAWSASAPAQESQQKALEAQFQSAVKLYNAGQNAEAARQLEELLPYSQKTFEVQELLGLVYAAQSKDAKAIEHLEIAVRLKPASAEARTNLAAALSHAGRLELAGDQFRAALQLEPGAYEANHNLGEFYIQAGKMAEARPLLAEAQRIQPSSYDNGYDLALADFLTGQQAEARQVVESLLPQKNTGELHNLLARIEEKDGKFIEAAKQFEIAAHLDPSEDNLFDWGGELLLHRTYAPAIEVFQQALARYPASPRLTVGLGMALYSEGKYDEAVGALLKAADLNPSDPRVYLFLSKAFNSAPSQAGEVIARFRRYSELEPDNGLALYYYALSLWKGKRVEDSSHDLQTVESLLKRAIAANAKLPEAHVELGNLYADQHQYARSIPEYESALALDPSLADAHYRLGQDYVHIGERDRAQSEFDLYQKLRAQHMAEVDKERAEVQQFVYAEKSSSSSKP